MDTTSEELLEMAKKSKAEQDKAREMYDKQYNNSKRQANPVALFISLFLILIILFTVFRNIKKQENK